MGGIQSEKQVCEEKAQSAFNKCLMVVFFAGNYYGKPEWNAAAVQDYSQKFCFVQFENDMKCPDQSKIKPNRSD